MLFAAQLFFILESSMLDPKPEVVVGERFELVRELARGGMGSVWLGRDRKLRRQVAIKLMVPLWAESSDARSRFEREAMAVAQLKSPHVVQVFDYGVQDNCPYIVMELLEGEDLRERLQREKRLTMEAAGIILLQTAKALTIAHHANIVHRDLKPGNIFMARGRDEEIVKVLDFGVAKADPASDIAQEATRAGSVLGTPQFMSPEQARALPEIDHRSDLWSLGVIMYRLLTGQLPFNGKSAGDVIVKICTETIVPASQLAPDLPQDIDRFFERALAREPDDRFSSAREMAHAFYEVLHVAPPGPISLVGSGPEGRVSYPSLPAFTPSGLVAAAQPPALLPVPPGDAPPDGEDNPTTMRSGKIAPVRISNSQATLSSALVSSSRPERSRGRRPLWIALGVTVAVAGVTVVAVMASMGTGPSPASAAMPAITGAPATASIATAPASAATNISLSGNASGSAAMASTDPSASTAAAPTASTAPRTVAPPISTAPIATHTATKTTAATTATTPPPPPPTGGDPFSERL